MPQRILIIEEKDGESLSLCKAFQEMGLQTFIVADPILGLQKTRELKPDLVVLNLISPGDSGYAVLERIRLAPETKKTPVIVLAGSGFSEGKEKILRCGVSRFFEKPHTTIAIQEEVRKVLRESRTVPRIVVVDDDPMLVKMLQSRLVANGFEVVTVTDSEEAIKIVIAEDPNLVITDIVMPNISGWKITQELKGNPRFRNLPIILLSSLIEKEGEAERHEVGDFFLSKPVMMDKLISKVREMLQSGQAPAA